MQNSTQTSQDNLLEPIPIQRLAMPWRITFDTNPDDCNLHCIMCEEFSEFSTIKQLHVEQGLPRKRRMDIKLIEKVIESASKYGILKEIIPSTMGEPLFYRDFDKIIELCHKYHVKLNLTTNGTFPGKKSVAEWAEKIVPVTSDVKISFNGATAETAEAVMKGVDYTKILQNIKEFIQVRDRIHKEGGNLCRVTLQLTFMEINYQEFPEIVKLASVLGANRIKGHHLWAHFDAIKDQSMRRNKDAILRWNKAVQLMRENVEKYPLPDGSKIVLDNIFPLDPDNSTIELKHDAICPFLGREAWVAWDGRFNPCCAPDEQRKTLGYFGNLNDLTLEDIWNSDSYNNLVKNYLTNDLCKTCNMRRPLEENNS